MIHSAEFANICSTGHQEHLMEITAQMLNLETLLAVILNLLCKDSESNPAQAVASISPLDDFPINKSRHMEKLRHDVSQGSKHSKWVDS